MPPVPSKLKWLQWRRVCPSGSARAGAGVALGVLLLHGLLGLALLRLGVWRDRVAPWPARAPLLVRLIDAPRPSAPAATALPSPRRTTAPTLEAARWPDVAAITTEAPSAPNAPPAAAQSATAPAPAPVPLDLRLPRSASAPWRVRSPALDDPRANTPRASFEQRLRDAMGGDGEWREERLGDDQVRFRRGSTCVDVERSRSDQLDPFNRAAGARPWIAKRPRGC
ncbi:MAG: hypothetical protein JNM33_17605 [Rubrivivax sp.]|nr:hypothetical protein [Rubrivivax sp.]